jgi:flagellar biosynthesis chaperone FliJ
MTRIVLERFAKIGKLPYKKQAQFFLNGLWKEFHHEAEKVWEYTNRMIKMDKKGENGCELEEFDAHRYLESFGQPMTALELRDRLKAIDLNEDHHMSLLEFLMDHFGAKIELLMSRPQELNFEGEMDLKKLMEMANQEIDRAKEALDHVNAEIAKIEAQKHDLEEKASHDGVKGKTAKQQLNSLLNEDHTGLNAAVLHAEASVRKAKKMMEEILSGDKTSIHTEGTMWWMDRELAEVKKYKPKGNLVIPNA